MNRTNWDLSFQSVGIGPEPWKHRFNNWTSVENRIVGSVRMALNERTKEGLKFHY
jgi:hypothetical protein